MIKPKNPKQELWIQKDSSTDTELDFLKYLAQVQSTIKSDITSDFTLAKLSEKDKEGIKEMTVNAYLCKQLSLELQHTKIHEWDNNTKIWYKRHLTKQEKEKILFNSQRIFDAFMNRNYMTVLLNRNVPDNDMLKILARQTPEPPLENEETIQAIDRLKETLKPEQQQKNKNENKN